MAKKSKPDGSQASSGPKETDSKATKEQKRKALLEVLIAAERTGSARWVLQGFADALRELDAKAGSKYDSTEAEAARNGRATIHTYLYSLIGGLDGRTKTEILQTLISDLWNCSKSPDSPDDGEFNRKGAYDAYASSGIVLGMRLLSTVYCRLAKEGGAAAEELAIYTSELVNTLSEIVRTQPKIVRAIAEERIDWPVMVTRHYPKTADFNRIADCIGLAEKCPVKPTKRHTWKPDIPINRHLVELLVVQTFGDGRTLTKDSVTYYLDDVVMPLI